MLLGDRTQGCRTGSSFQLGSRGSEVRPATKPKHPTLTLRPWRIIPTLPTPTPGSVEVRAEGTFSEAARHLETTAASCETDWLLAFGFCSK